MPCFGPLTGYYSAERNPVTGKRSIVFKKDEKALSGIPVRLPCGRCNGCRLERSRQWAMRCLHEAKLHKSNVFLTLTYDDKHLPHDLSLDLAELSLFAKRLHNRLLRSRGFGIRYYGCGEYGDLNGRPHYHLLVFGHDFEDKVFFSRGKREGEILYQSAYLDDCWKLGMCTIGAVNFDSAAYVARYIMKKITGPMADDHYMGRRPEGTVMSRRPGVGLDFCQRYADEIYSADSVIVNGREVPPPRFYDLYREKVDPEGFAVVKKERKRRALTDLKRKKLDSTSRRLVTRELVMMAKLRLNQRRV